MTIYLAMNTNLEKLGYFSTMTKALKAMGANQLERGPFFDTGYKNLKVVGFISEIPIDKKLR